MKIRALICALLCSIILCTAACATENTASDSQNIQEETIPAPPEERQTDGQMPPGGGPGGMRGGRGMRPGMQQNSDTTQQSGEQMPQEGQMPPDGFGGGRGGMGEGMQVPSEQNQAENTEGFTVSKTDSITYISSAVLLVLAFLFAIFYKRKTF